MTDSRGSYSPLAWDGLSEKTSRLTTTLKALRLYWKNVTICSLLVSTTVLLTLLLDHRTESSMKHDSHSMLPES